MARKLSKIWSVLVLACVLVVASLAVNAAPVLVMGPARAVVWLAQGVAWVLLPGKAAAQDMPAKRATTVVLYRCTELAGTDSVMCELLSPFSWTDKAIMARRADGVLVGFSLDACGARMVTLDRAEGLYSSVAIGSSTCRHEPAVRAVDVAEQW